MWKMITFWIVGFQIEFSLDIWAFTYNLSHFFKNLSIQIMKAVEEEDSTKKCKYLQSN